MILHSEDGRSKYELRPCGEEMYSYPSLCFSVSATTPDVSGGVGEVWFELPAVEQFISDLVTLDQSRSGAAALESISPGQFSLQIVALNRRGHLGVRFSFCGSRQSESTSFSHSLGAGFQIDPTILHQIAESLRSDIRQQRQSSTETP